MAVREVQVTFYKFTGYSPNDEPANDSVINQNEHWAMPSLISVKEEPARVSRIKVDLPGETAKQVDYIKLQDTKTGERWYYFILNGEYVNGVVSYLNLLIDNFATVGLSNIAFFGNISRRSLSQAETGSYPRLPEPWAPRRPLKARRIILDLNVNKVVRIPSHISTVFETENTSLAASAQIDVPSSPLGLTTTTDSLALTGSVPMLYPTPAQDTTHTVNTPWGADTYITPHEEYLTLSVDDLATFLANAKKSNSLDLVGTPYYLPQPNAAQSVTISELSGGVSKNLKARKHYITVTIRALASNSARTFSDSDTDLEYDQPISVVIAPDKNGGIYVMPATIRDTGLNVYTYLEGVYSPFETIPLNAVGDTPGKFAADGTNIVNTALNTLFQTYINKINALQYEGMQAKYFKDVSNAKALVMTFSADLLGTVAKAVTTTDKYEQDVTITTNTPDVIQSGTQNQKVPRITQSQSGDTTTDKYSTTQPGVMMPKISSSQESVYQLRDVTNGIVSTSYI
jgi:hypothetical protein